MVEANQELGWSHYTNYAIFWGKPIILQTVSSWFTWNDPQCGRFRGLWGQCCAVI